MSTIREEDFIPLIELGRLPWEEEFSAWKKTNRAMIKYLFNELSSEDASVVKKVIDTSDEYRILMNGLSETKPNSNDADSEEFIKKTEAQYEVIFGNLPALSPTNK